MQKYLLTYHGKPDIQGPEDGARHMAAWKAWSAGLGKAVVDPGVPVGPSVTVTPTEVLDHGGANPVSGVTIVQAPSIEAAIAMAQSCPHVSGEGTIEVAEVLSLDM